MTTNRKNSRLKYQGHNNNRMYQWELSERRNQKRLRRSTNNFIFGSLKGFGFIFWYIIGLFITKKQEEEMAIQKAEQELVAVREQRERERKARERKAKKEAKDNELIDQYFKNMGKFIDGKYITISLEDYRKMSDKERKEWNEIRKKEESGIILL